MSLCSQRAESKQHSLQAVLAYYQPKLNLAVSAAAHAVSKQAYAMTSSSSHSTADHCSAAGSSQAKPPLSAQPQDKQSKLSTDHYA